jgi:hypothetical protein
MLPEPKSASAVLTGADQKLKVDTVKNAAYIRVSAFMQIEYQEALRP